MNIRRFESRLVLAAAFAFALVAGSGCTAGGRRAEHDASFACAEGTQDHDHDGVCEPACNRATCTGHGGCNDATGLAVCTCTGRYEGDACDHCATGRQDNDHNGICDVGCTATTCSGHGNCTDATGTTQCACTGGYAGAVCAACAAGSQDNDRNGICSGACIGAACSGHGACADATGTAVCTCTGGYAGAMCESCGPRLQDNDHDGLCTAACTAITCSGHGACDDASGSAMCACSASFTGADCSTCPAGQQDRDHDGVCSLACDATTCTGHGTCDDASGTAACACVGGYSGTTCAACATGTQDNDGDGVCRAQCSAGACSGHGTCSDASGAVECACTDGFGGDDCSACAPGLQDHDHDGACTPECTVDACSGHGACDDASGAVVCACANGYAGPACAGCPARLQDNDHDGVCSAACGATSCSNHGACVDTTGATVCTCTGNYTGATCDVCSTGLQDNDHDGTCTADCSSMTCSGFGTCSDTSGVASCACATGHTGIDCSGCREGLQDNDRDGACMPACTSATCSGHGACIDTTGTAVCTCTGGYAGGDCGACDSGLQDNDHDGACTAACTSTTCSTHGACSDATGSVACTCTANRTGVNCDTCAAGYQDADHDGACALACTATTCSGHGACVDSTGAAVCTCTGNHAGATCATCGAGLQDNDHDGACAPACVATTCSGFGLCSDASGAAVCACQTGHTGSTCSGCGPGLQDHDGDGTCAPACTLATCSGHGACSDATGVPVCACTGGYAGADCSACGAGLQDNDHDGACTAACSGATCSGHGACSDAGGTARCTCTDNHAGSDCSGCGPLYQDHDHDGVCALACTATMCSGHGNCTDASGSAACNCTSNHAGATCTACASGYQDNDADGACKPSCTSATCSGHGACSDAGGTATCTCATGYRGATCVTCATGYQDNDANGTCAAACVSSTCAGHGTCADATGTAVCTCATGYRGATCSACATGYQDNDADGTCSVACTQHECNGRGYCVDASGTAACSCGVPYGGNACGSTCMTRRTWSTCTGTAGAACSFPVAASPSVVTYDCATTPHPTYCGVDTARCGANECIANLAFAYDMGSSVRISRVRITSGAGDRRPITWEVWVGQTASQTPRNGATRIASSASASPYACVTGLPCTTDAPDVCCPDGRDHVQNTRTSGAAQARWNDATFPATSGRYWYVVVPSTIAGAWLEMQWLEFWDDQCG